MTEGTEDAKSSGQERASWMQGNARKRGGDRVCKRAVHGEGPATLHFPFRGKAKRDTQAGARSGWLFYCK